ncbi:hypothetical protein [Sphingobium sp. CFD-1]|jgi:hypothetical protein|uniref:hypothetical protein n=1 Tax=Sphingobium sp. CFD-1 TaxID=2878545 RepID=UPI00214C232C|nr:hypothetical protein [Sphingobium sp. CFD-1]
MMRIAFNVFERGELLKRLPEEAQGVGGCSQAQQSELPSCRLTGLEIGDVLIRTGQSQTSPWKAWRRNSTGVFPQWQRYACQVDGVDEDDRLHAKT